MAWTGNNRIYGDRGYGRTLRYGDDRATHRMTYVIRSVGDLLKVPADRRAACLDELRECLEHIDELRNQNPGVDVDWMAEFQWTDDDKRETEHILI